MAKLSSIACLNIFFIPLRILCIGVIIGQAYIINQFLVNHYNKLWYAWFTADGLSVALFIVSFVNSYHHVKSKKSGKPTRHLFNGKLGQMPFIYLSWLVYSIFLAARVGIIFYHIAPTLDEKNVFGPNMLKTGLALSSIIFCFHVVIHIAAEPKEIQNTYISGIISRITVDVLDTVQFLEILIIPESHVMFDFSMHRTIIAIGCLNLILPTFKLAMLSVWHFGTLPMVKILETYHLVLYLVIINLPMLVIRILIWSVHSQDISVFIIKNVLSLTMTIRAIHEHCTSIYSKSENEDKPETIALQDHSLQKETSEPNPQNEQSGNVLEGSSKFV